MKIIYEYDSEKIKDIVLNCNSPNVKKTYSYLSVVNFHSKNKFLCVIVDDCAFMAGTIAKKHFRLIEIAVKSDNQHQGYGNALLTLLKKICLERGLEKITLRTSRHEKAVKFFLRHKGKIVGVNGEDYEMEIKV